MLMRVRERLLSIRLMERIRKQSAVAESVVLSAEMIQKPAAEKRLCERKQKKT